MDLIFQVVLSASFLKCKDIYAILRLALYPNENESVNTSQLMLLVENIKVLSLRKENAIKKALYKPVILILDNVSVTYKSKLNILVTKYPLKRKKN